MIKQREHVVRDTVEKKSELWHLASKEEKKLYRNVIVKQNKVAAERLVKEVEDEGEYLEK